MINGIKREYEIIAKWCINNKSKIRKMGEKSFEIYKRYFSQNVFETNLLKYVEEMV